jgi:hypothetical protein
MKTTLLLLRVLFGFLALHLTAMSAAEVEIIPVAVLDFEAADPKLKERGAQMALLITTHLSTQENVATVERQELAKLLGEQELGASGMVDPATAARIGHLTGARVLVTGRMFTVAGETTAALKVMSTETGRVYGVAENFSPDAAPSGPAGKLATKIGEVLKMRRDALVARVLSDDDRAARIKQKLAGKSLPSVAISIPEQHIASPVIDPAAETEIGLILGKAGFTILTGESAAKADYQIKGEAFSEAGIRRGGLISCRARVEVKVVAREGGRVALMDRQVAWSVDTAEHVSAKGALQAAGAGLAERIADAVTAKN